MSPRNRLLAFTNDREEDLDTAEATLWWYAVTVRDEAHWGCDMNYGQLTDLEIQFELALEKLQDMAGELRKECEGR